MAKRLLELVIPLMERLVPEALVKVVFWSCERPVTAKALAVALVRLALVAPSDVEETDEAKRLVAVA